MCSLSKISQILPRWNLNGVECHLRHLHLSCSAEDGIQRLTILGKHTITYPHTWPCKQIFKVIF